MLLEAKALEDLTRRFVGRPSARGMLIARSVSEVSSTPRHAPFLPRQAWAAGGATASLRLVLRVAGRTCGLGHPGTRRSFESEMDLCARCCGAWRISEVSDCREPSAGHGIPWAKVLEVTGPMEVFLTSRSGSTWTCCGGRTRPGAITSAAAAPACARGAAALTVGGARGRCPRAKRWPPPRQGRRGAAGRSTAWRWISGGRTPRPAPYA